MLHFLARWWLNRKRRPGVRNQRAALVSRVRRVPLEIEMLERREMPSTVEFSAANYSVQENAGSAAVTVTRSDGFGSFAFSYAAADGTAHAGVDYTAASGTVYFNAGETSRAIAIPILDHAAYQGNKTVNLSLSPCLGLSLGTQGTAVLTILDYHAPPAAAPTPSQPPAPTPTPAPAPATPSLPPDTIQFSAASYSVQENAGSATITVTRQGGGGAYAFGYATGDGTARAGVDYTAASGTLYFAASETSKTFTVSVIDHATYQGNKALNLSLTPYIGLSLGNPTTAVLTLVDYHSQGPTSQSSPATMPAVPVSMVQFSAATYSASEAAGRITVTITRSGDVSGNAQAR